MSEVVNFNGLNLEVLEYRNTWALSNRQVADGFGVSEEAIRSQKSRGEYRNNVHFYTVANCNGGGDLTFWTKKGVITLGFKLRETPQTIAFRDWASDFIIKSNEIVSKKSFLAQAKFTEILTALQEKSNEANSAKLEILTLKDELIYTQRKLIEKLEKTNSSNGQTLKKSTRLSSAEKDEIVRLYKSGLSQSEICRQTDRSDTAVRNAIRGAL